MKNKLAKLLSIKMKTNLNFKGMLIGVAIGLFMFPTMLSVVTYLSWSTEVSLITGNKDILEILKIVINEVAGMGLLISLVFVYIGLFSNFLAVTVNKPFSLIGVNKPKEAVKEWPNIDKVTGEECEVWIGNKNGMSNQCNLICPLNLRNNDNNLSADIFKEPININTEGATLFNSLDKKFIANPQKWSELDAMGEDEQMV